MRKLLIKWPAVAVTQIVKLKLGFNLGGIYTD